MIFTLIMIAVTAVVLRPLINSWRKLISTVAKSQSGLKTATLLLAGLLLSIAAFGWLLMAYVLAQAVWHAMGSSGPAPFVLLPWFIGLCLYGIPAEFANKLLVIIRGEDPLKD